MAMTKTERLAIKSLIIQCLQKKFDDYDLQDRTEMPFHNHLLGKDNMSLFSFIHSLNTVFGTVIYGPVAKKLATSNFKEVVCEKKLESVISEGAQQAINRIKNDLERSQANPNQKEEVKKIRKVCRVGSPVNIQLRRADIYLVDASGRHYPIDIKTAKPNIDGFEKYKENILKWTAAVLYQNPKANVSAMLALPYNPYYPEKYRHFTKRKMIEEGTQLKVGGEFWNFLAGKDVYEDLLNCFKYAGIEMRNQIDEYFEQFGGNN